VITCSDFCRTLNSQQEKNFVVHSINAKKDFVVHLFYNIESFGVHF